MAVVGTATFTWLNKQAGSNAVKKATEKVADEVLALAVAYAPQDTGTLANSLERTPVKTSIRTATCYVGTPVHYAPFVEFGTRYSPVPPGRVRHGGRRPFLGPALNKVKAKYGG